MLRLFLVIFLNYGDCMDDEALKAQLRLHEGERLLPYLDTEGKWTIGIGRNLTDRGISVATMEQMLCEDIELVKAELDSIYPDWGELSENRQLVLADMTFNLGAPRFLNFVKFWAALRVGDYERAADEMIDSRWYRQVGDRGERLQVMMREG